MPDEFPIDPDPAQAPPAVRRFLWKGGVGAALFVASVLLSLVFVGPGFAGVLPHCGRDFLAFYAAGTLVREGRAGELYDLEAVGQIERRVAREQGFDLGDAVGPWWNPPGYAWAFLPLAGLPFGAALAIWTGVNLAAACCATWVLGRIACPAGGGDRWLVALLVLASAPFIQSITHGQNSAISLLLVSVAIAAWRGGSGFVAGACVGLLLYKPQLAAVLGGVLVLRRGWRAGAGLACVGAAVALVTVLTMPGALSDWLHRLPQNLHAIQVERTYLWERHVTLHAFWRLIVQGRDAGETAWVVHLPTIVCAAPLLLGLPFAALRRTSNDALIAATLASAPLLMPFYFDYDLLLLAAAAALVTVSRRRALLPWAALYVWLFINPYVAGAARVNVSVVLLYALAASLLWKCLRGTEDVAPAEAAAGTVGPARPLARAA